MKLTIAIITMNRSEQLKMALQSCINCDLPKDTQFVIIDNASTDNTESSVRELFEFNCYEYIYHKNQENVGAGKGRNIAFDLSKGEYIYFLDDDAYIDKNQKHFFDKAISILDHNPEIVTLTTQIYDLIWKANRVSINNPILYDGLQKCYMVCGGSHFLRSSFWEGKEPFFNNKYGYEELQPSLRGYDAGKLSVTYTSLRVIHNPLINKWDYSADKNKDIIVGDLINQLVIKKSIYPYICIPIVYIAFVLRFIKFLSIKDVLLCKEKAKHMNNYDFGKRIKIKTLIHLYTDFGFTVF